MKKRKSASSTPSRRLRKQPQLRRVHASRSVSLPKLEVPRTAKRRRRRNSGRLKVPTVALRKLLTSARWLSLALVVTSVYALLQIGQRETFFLETIPVEGAGSIPPSEIVAASGLAGTHIFAADPNVAAARIGQLPGVISATVTLEWPNQVNIRIGEEAPVAIWEQAGETFWINQHGELIPARLSVPGLLRIKSELEEPVGEVNTVAPEVLQGALKLRELRPNIDLLFHRPGSGLSYQDGRGWRVYFGAGGEMAQKLVIYETIVDDLLTRELTPEYVSVGNQSRPFYKALAADTNTAS